MSMWLNILAMIGVCIYEVVIFLLHFVVYGAICSLAIGLPLMAILYNGPLGKFFSQSEKREKIQFALSGTIIVLILATIVVAMCFYFAGPLRVIPKIPI